MSNILTVKDVEGMDDGDIVKCIQGTITAIYEAKKGDTYEYQNGLLKDATGTVAICFSKCSQPLSAKGREVILTSHKTEKFGWQGVKIEDQRFEKEGKQVTKRVLKITPTASIEYQGAPPAADQAKGAAPGKATSTAPAKHPLAILDDLIDCYSVCLTRVRADYPDIPFEDQRAIATTIFIEGNKGYGLSNDFNVRANADPNAKPEPPAESESPAEPERPVKEAKAPDEAWRKVVIPKGLYKGKTLAEVPEEKLKELFNYYDTNGDNSPMAEAVYAAAFARGVVQPAKVDADDNVPY